jgi:site-specific DNA-methyltransferase (adenine-specific)
MHRITCAIEDACFEIRDTLQWVFGSGFPKSLDVGKAIDKAAGAEREVVGDSPFSGRRPRPGNGPTIHMPSAATITAPATEAARTWHGYGTALKPAHEPITLARKPLDGTVASNVAKWGTGGIDVDGCRVGDGKRVPASPRRAAHSGFLGALANADGTTGFDPNVGRWPPNLLIGDGAAEVIDGMSGVRSYSPQTFSGEQPHDSRARATSYGFVTGGAASGKSRNAYRDGGASEFFPTFCYVPKASRREREAGLAEAGIEPMTRADVTGREEGSDGLGPRAGTRQRGEIRNTHPTVKPIAIMQWLVRLVSPPRSLSPLILDPFAGSGSTGVACVREGVRFVGVELDERHAAIARARIAHALETQPKSDDEPKGRLF